MDVCVNAAGVTAYRDLMAVVKIMAFTFALACATAAAQGLDGEQFPPDQIKKGAGIFAQNCAPCHGARMADPQAAFDLRKFPPDQKSRFVTSIMKRSEERRVGKECRL